MKGHKMKKLKICHVVLLLAAILGFWQEQSFAQDKLAQAQTAISKRDFVRAETLCNEFIGESKDEIATAQAHALLSQIYMELVKSNARYYANVETNLKIAISKDPSNTSYRKQFGELNERLGKPNEAIAQYEKVVELGKEDEDVLRKLIEYYELKQADDKLLRYYRRLVALKPSDSMVYYRIGQLLRGKGLSESAKDTLNKAILANGENWDAYVELGELYDVEGNYDHASQTFDKARKFVSKAQEGWERTTRSKASVDLIQTTLRSANLTLSGSKIPELTKVTTQLDSLREKYPKNSEVKIASQNVRKALCDLWFQKAQSEANAQNLQAATKAFDASFSYAESEADKNRARDGASRAEAELRVQIRVQTVETEAEKALKERKLKEAQQGFIAVIVFDPSRRSTLSERQKQVEIDSWYFLGIAARDSSRWDEAKLYFKHALKLDNTRSDIKMRYNEADSLLACQQRIAFLSKMADSTYKNERWAVANFALTELQRMLPNDQTIKPRLSRAEEELGTTKTIKRVLTFWSVLSFGVIAALIFWVSKNFNFGNGRAGETPALDWMRP